MIENIKLIGVDDNTIEKMVNILGYDIVLNMACNHELVNKNIQLLKSVGINNIEQLLLNREYIFLKDNDFIKNCLSKYNLQPIVPLINEDYSVIDEIID